eukprot:4308631-Prymnesium_polylepis.1
MEWESRKGSETMVAKLVRIRDLCIHSKRTIQNSPRSHPPNPRCDALTDCPLLCVLPLRVALHPARTLITPALVARGPTLTLVRAYGAGLTHTPFFRRRHSPLQGWSAFSYGLARTQHHIGRLPQQEFVRAA